MKHVFQRRFKKIQEPHLERERNLPAQDGAVHSHRHPRHHRKNNKNQERLNTQANQQGESHFLFGFVGQPARLLSVRVHKAVHLRSAPILALGGIQSPYVHLQIGGQTKRTAQVGKIFCVRHYLEYCAHLSSSVVS